MITRRNAFKLAGAVGAGAAVTSLTGTAAAAATGRDVLAVVEKGDRRLAFFDPDSGERLSDVVLGDYPHEIVADAECRYGYVGHYGVEFSSAPGQGGSAVFVVDLRARSLLRTIELGPFHRVHGVRMDAAGRLYALSEEQAVLLGVDNPRTDPAPSRAVATGGIKTHLFSLSRDGERAYVTGLLSHTVSLVRPHDPSVPPVVTTPGQLPESSCLSADERTLFVGARKTPAVVALDARTLRVKNELKVPGDPLRVYSVGEDRLLVTDLTGKSISLLRTDFRPIWTAAMPGQPASVAFHPSRPVAYVSLLDTQRVAVVDLGGGRITSSFPTLRQPDSAVLIPAS
ncbi:YncE family protein [Amycolatopsis samaneae]|uniref:YncE family protein n=1 Tax=Amycolatopsis samaneae TaxID=664691 RepID=A0ABW5GS49_9PSEU